MGAGASFPSDIPASIAEESDKPKVVYFDGAGMAEFIRLTFVVGGIEFEDVRLTKEQWAEVKPLTPFGHLPVIVDKVRRLNINTQH